MSAGMYRMIHRATAFALVSLRGELSHERACAHTVKSEEIAATES